MNTYIYIYVHDLLLSIVYVAALVHMHMDANILLNLWHFLLFATNVAQLKALCQHSCGQRGPPHSRARMPKMCKKWQNI